MVAFAPVSSENRDGGEEDSLAKGSRPDLNRPLAATVGERVEEYRTAVQLNSTRASMRPRLGKSSDFRPDKWGTSCVPSARYAGTVGLRNLETS